MFTPDYKNLFPAALLGLSLVAGLTSVKLRLQPVKAAAKPAPVIINLQESPNARLHQTSTGALNGINLTQENGAIFPVEDSDALTSFKRWVMNNTALLKLDPIE